MTTVTLHHAGSASPSLDQKRTGFGGMARETDMTDECVFRPSTRGDFATTIPADESSAQPRAISWVIGTTMIVASMVATIFSLPSLMA